MLNKEESESPKENHPPPTTLRVAQAQRSARDEVREHAAALAAERARLNAKQRADRQTLEALPAAERVRLREAAMRDLSALTRNAIGSRTHIDSPTLASLMVQQLEEENANASSTENTGSRLASQTPSERQPS